MFSKIPLIGILLFSTILLGNIGNSSNEIEDVKEVITKAYIEGIHINRNIDEIKKGFHQEFNMLILNENGIKKFPISNWISSIEKSIKDHPEPSKVKTTYEIPLVDITGKSAIAKIEIFKDSKHIYTDYMSLYKFDDGWKIVSKIYHKH